MTRVRCIVNTIDQFTDYDECAYFLEQIKDEKIFMIISGDLVEHVVPALHDTPQLDSIFVFCGNQTLNEQWVSTWPKVKGVFTNIELICQSLKKAALRCDQNFIRISLVPPNDTSATFNQNLNQLDHTFMYTQILKEILLEINNYGTKCVQDLAYYCREQSIDSGNIDKFEQEYRLQTPVWWYTYDCCLYPMLNRALRTLEVDTIVKMGFFIHDLHQQVQQLHNQQVSATTFVVYRGQGLSENNLQNIRKMKGGLLSFNNFLSTSKDPHVSFLFAESALSNPELVGILFQMTINPVISSAPFADLNEVSCYKDQEQEILFSMHTVFRIDGITQVDGSNRLWRVELTLTVDNDPQFNALTERIRQETTGSSGWSRLGQLLIKLGEFDQAERVYETLLDRNTSDECEMARLYYQLGRVKDMQGEYRTALTFYDKSLEIRERVLSSNDPDLACSYSSIGIVYYHMGDYSEALSSHEKALEIRQIVLPPNHPDLAYSYNSLGLVYDDMGDYTKALSCYEKDLEITAIALPPNHPDLATSYNNIGLVYRNMGDYSQALSYYGKALEIWKIVLPPNHANLAKPYIGIGVAYYNMGDYSEALSSHEKALEIRQMALPSNHSDLAYSYNNIGLVYRSMGHYSKALSFQEKALEIRQIALPPNHPDLATSYNDVGNVYDNMHNFSKALWFYERAVETGQRSLPPDHSHLQLYRRNLDNAKKNCK
ncbi:unnamed protein product [Adineta ricciae]|uniref:Kinesin light chain n=1 Tax=Adineta ricciae TaxID=249248 RepID=A0A815NDN2_ADIRI|nr:unnamed protein product [Adineta ricciae]CAF1438042.1 unnamed protein product [Adineta ricciae]